MENYLKEIKENLSVIAIIPLILGGVWQIAELASISSSYIRFFSVTQQLADGLLIVFILIIFYVTYLFITYAFFKNKGFKIQLHTERSIWYILLRMGGMVVILLIMMYYYGNIFDTSNKLKDDFLNGDIHLPKIIFFAIITGILMIPIIGFFFFVLVLIKKITNFSINIKSESYKQNIVFIVAIAFIFGSKLLFVVIPALHDAYTIPKNLVNTKYVLDKYSKENKILDRNKLKIIYMNDKYIFIKDSLNVEVVKFDYMFKNEK